MQSPVTKNTLLGMQRSAHVSSTDLLVELNSVHLLQQISDELDHTKQEMEERGSAMTDGGGECENSIVNKFVKKSFL